MFRELKSILFYCRRWRYIRGLFYSIRYRNIAWPCAICKGLKKRNMQWVFSDKGLTVDDHAEFFLAKLRDGIKTPCIEIGKDVWIGRHNILSCFNRIKLGNHVLLGPYVFIIDNEHYFEDVTTPISKQGSWSKGPIEIGDETWVGAYSKILGGVKIGKHCVIGAGSLVTRDIPDYSIAVGSPARVIKRYDFEKHEWVKL